MAAAGASVPDPVHTVCDPPLNEPGHWAAQLNLTSGTKVKVHVRSGGVEAVVQFD